MHVVAVLALDGVVGFELTIPCQVFGTTPGYEVRVCAERSVRATAHGQEFFRVSSRYTFKDAQDADTLVVPGIEPGKEPSRAVLKLLRDAAARGARIASVCTGAFVLAYAGLLNGRKATTHWIVADDLAKTFPEVTVDPSVLFVDEGQILTSAGVAAGLDLCLHMVRLDYGAAVAATTARGIVMPPQRPGGQAQFIEHVEPAADTNDLAPVLQWMQSNMDNPLTIADIAARATMSTRYLSRRFRAQTGTTPLRWLLDRRLQRARELLETTGIPVDRVAQSCGFGSPETLRHHFAKHVGTTPRDYRAAFQASREITSRSAGTTALDSVNR
ncbi:helix-turn-helix domain-containing protein [Kibdelosporangium philippinense]|uniref:Helix-turn-helix domain-containing protein n=2 Tax=Kibdelosporangium philippinense TaxID=211113 RepID=A0ABS8ZIA0_9PSEU|nr:helix-turn-helix domain-containing protein [Kibdelosporangium philippinense]MCE7006655.1 helix-turn-helix domain-containing protein [Kibdelosporangium philippinense]